MVEWGGLENRCSLRATEGSNPSLSAKKPSTLTLGGSSSTDQIYYDINAAPQKHQVHQRQSSQNHVRNDSHIPPHKKAT